MKFIILNRDQMKDYKCDKPHIIISIKDPECDDIEIAERKNCFGILCLSFHDFDDLSKDYPGKIVLFSKEDAKRILIFVRLNAPVKINTIICQCEAGISRSTGVAGALSKIINGDDKAIFRHYLPNMLVYQTIIKEAYEQGIYNKYLETIIEEALAKADNTDVRKHHNLLGNKKKYIKAILEALRNERT